MDFIKICDNIYNEDVNSLEEGFYRNKDLNDIVFVDKHKCFFTLGSDFESFMNKYLETNKPKMEENIGGSVSVETMLKAIAVANGNVKDVEL